MWGKQGERADGVWGWEAGNKVHVRQCQKYKKDSGGRGRKPVSRVKRKEFGQEERNEEITIIIIIAVAILLMFRRRTRWESCSFLFAQFFSKVSTLDLLREEIWGSIRFSTSSISIFTSKSYPFIGAWRKVCNLRIVFVMVVMCIYTFCLCLIGFPFPCRMLFMGKVRTISVLWNVVFMTCVKQLMPPSHTHDS